MPCFCVFKNRTRSQAETGSFIGRASSSYRRRFAIQFRTFLVPWMKTNFSGNTSWDDARMTLHQLQVRKEALERVSRTALERVRRFVIDARRVGLIGEEFESNDVERLVRELKRVASADVRAPTIVDSGSEVIGGLEREIQSLRGELSAVQGDIRATQVFLREQSNFSKEWREQKARLESIELYKGNPETDETCPVCETPIGDMRPTASDLIASLRVLEAQLGAVGLRGSSLTGALRCVWQATDRNRGSYCLDPACAGAGICGQREGTYSARSGD